MKNRSLYQEFVISKNLRTASFCQILNPRLDIFLKLKEKAEGSENYILGRMKA